MDALSLIPKSAESDPFWCGSLSMALALTLKGDQHIGKRTLDDFLRSPLPSSELRSMLKEELRK